MSMLYRGQAEITDRDDAGMTAAMRVQARESRGQGTANATVQIGLADEDSGTRATMATELRLSGRAAAMGRGVITDVSKALVSEFADNLARMLSQPGGDGAGPASEGAAPSESAPASAAASSATVPPSAGTPPPPAPPRPAEGPPPPAEAPQPPAQAPQPASSDALDAGKLAKNVVAGRLGQPGALAVAGGLLALAGVAVGYRLGRRSRSR
jgi:hypothetical protein